MSGGNYCAIYDFELFPYALGDVLTWNVQTAILCEEAGRERVDVYVCMDERYPASIFQLGMVTADNYGLMFNELFGAFGTHPCLANLFIYQNRDEMLERLAEVNKGDATNLNVVNEYRGALALRAAEPSMRQLITSALKRIEEKPTPIVEYFSKYIYSHDRINSFAEKYGRIPLLRSSMGCEPDVTSLITKRFSDKRIVVVHSRLRRLDVGFGAGKTYARDSDFLEWYEFLKEAAKEFPDVQFVVVGRLQEKPLELLRLANVTSLRPFGLGLGHELSLMLRSDLFIGTSSGFAAMANFSKLPYFVTKMTPASCTAYGIDQNSERLPFATERQILVYQPETRGLLMKLLARGLQGVSTRSGNPPPPRMRSTFGVGNGNVPNSCTPVRRLADFSPMTLIATKKLHS